MILEELQLMDYTLLIYFLQYPVELKLKYDQSYVDDDHIDVYWVRILHQHRQQCHILLIPLNK